MDTRAIGRDWPERVMDRFSSGFLKWTPWSGPRKRVC